MNSVAVSLIAFACLFGGTILGMFLGSRLPEHHQSAESQRIVNLGAGIIGTMAALILGLLVASAKGAYDTQSNELTVIAAKLVLLDRGLAIYGPDAAHSRVLLRDVVNDLVEQLWPGESRRGTSRHEQPTDAAGLYETVQRLSPQSELQRTLKTQALAILMQVGEQRWLIIEQGQRSVSRPLLTILLFSLTVNFLSFGLFAPRNATVIVTLCLCSIATASAIFLIMELYHPFGGFIQIPSTTLRSALAQMGQ